MREENSMFCGKCGAENANNAEFCKSCGAKLKKETNEKKTLTLPDKDDKNKRIGIIAVILLIIVVVLAGIFLFGGRSYKGTIKKYVNATFDADGEEILDLLPEKMIDYAMEEEGQDSEDLDEIIDDMNEELQDQLDSLDEYLGEGWKISYEITDDENIKGDDLEDIKEAYEDADIKVSAAKEAEVEITVKADETENSNTLDIALIKVGRSWYLDIMSMGNLF